ncbi:hypothetical protein TCAL_14295 [Tigriopus californicus]|uniref:3-dehydrosphinganine reductase n=1 Tax=Tigriopus californicus TaxID=6832 RepID=A0A553NEQ3_TIGCA|nr:3-ketodihydrosphingosine reductase-like [Tigriopus californicus]TRY63926.1 hypothetical protein TCAL_14295 [Tigriopus californicus]|eukprot:TCALIF_03545-PB protein Name:"Similar to KDSR 3-ketodihydrosphingosine reductase (Homo sapiens)" AED:0.25 eAED:0.25 QI:164/1/1/1/1/1/2/1785/335
MDGLVDWGFWHYLGVIAVILLAWLLILDRCTRYTIQNKHVLVTGGSSGIGLSLAKLCAQRGARHITLVARQKLKLVEAKAAVEQCLRQPAHQQVHTISLDITGDLETIQASLESSITGYGRVDVLINCAGAAVARRFEETSDELHRRMMDLNYFGGVRLTQVLLPPMKLAENGLIIFVSSQAGLIGVFGFTAYTAAKFAMRGFAEALEMEVKAHGVGVTVAFPPDTDTPGFAEEEKGKPEETKLISQSGGLFHPDAVAKSILSDALRGRFYSSPGVDGWMLTNVCVGMTHSSLFQVLVQGILLGPLRVVGWAYRQYFYAIIRKCRAKRNSEKKHE